MDENLQDYREEGMGAMDDAGDTMVDRSEEFGEQLRSDEPTTDSLDSSDEQLADEDEGTSKDEFMDDTL